MTTEPPIEKPPLESRLSARETYRILLMDTVEHTDELKAVCKEAGHAVVAAHSIDEAFAFLDGKDHADVIVCAAYLEDESMFAFLRRLKADEHHQATKFMALALETSPTGLQVQCIHGEGLALTWCRYFCQHGDFRSSAIDCGN